MGGSFFKNIKDFTLKFGLIPKNDASRENVIWIDSGEVGAIVHPLHGKYNVFLLLPTSELLPISARVASHLHLF